MDTFFVEFGVDSLSLFFNYRCTDRISYQSQWEIGLVIIGSNIKTLDECTVVICTLTVSKNDFKNLTILPLTNSQDLLRTEPKLCHKVQQ